MGYLLIFDMDGTLIDSEKSIVRCFKESAGRKGYEIGDVSKYIGVLKLTQILSRYGVPSEELPGIMNGYVECYLETFASDTTPIGNSPIVLKKLQERNELGILTLKNRGLALEITRRFFQGIDFKYVIGGDRPIENKVEGLRIILEESGISPDRVFYIGDRAGDIRSAREAGINSVWVSFGLGKTSDFDFGEGFRTADSFDDLLKIFSSPA